MEFPIRNLSNDMDISMPIWRYMALDKFIDLLETKSLFFTRIDKFNDPFEGYLYPEYYTKRYVNLSEEESKSAKKESLHYINSNITKVYANCWHANKYESEAMWKIYGGNNLSIAIKTTISSLISSFGNLLNKNKRQETCSGLVNYIGPNDGKFVIADIADYALHKRKAFEHEKEYRLICINNARTRKPGFGLPINFDDLVKSIYISPLSSPWQQEVVRKILKKYNKDIEPITSDINKNNIYRNINS
jgi:hypothetical protein